MAKKLRKGCVTTIYYAKFFIARACICAGSGFLLFISRFLTLSHLCEASHKWMFGKVISAGMKAEIEKAEKKKMLIRYFTEELEEVKGL